MTSGHVKSHGVLGIIRAVMSLIFDVYACQASLTTPSCNLNLLYLLTFRIVDLCSRILIVNFNSKYHRKQPTGDKHPLLENRINNFWKTHQNVLE